MWAFVTYLGLPEDEWKNVEYEHRGRNTRVLKIVALRRCKTYLETEWKRLTCKMLQEALIKTDQDIHKLCKIFREDLSILEIEHTALQQEPDDDTLMELSGQIGVCALELGLELGVDIVEIERILEKHNKDPVLQNYDILMKWKNLRRGIILRKLMQALKSVRAGGLIYLDDKYGIGLFKQE